MNNLNPLYEMNARLAKKAIKASLSNTLGKQGKLTANQTAKASDRFFAKGISDNGQVKGRLGDLYSRAVKTKKGSQLAAKIANGN